MAPNADHLFRFAIGQQVRYCDGTDTTRVYTIVGRIYEERQIMGPVVMYRLERNGIMLHSAYEPDIEEVA